MVDEYIVLLEARKVVGVLRDSLAQEPNDDTSAS